MSVITKAIRHYNERTGLKLYVPSVRKLRESKGRLRYLTEIEVDTLLKAELRDDWRLFWSFLIDTGARLSDGLIAGWHEIDWTNGLWTCANSKVGSPMSLPLRKATVDGLLLARNLGVFRPFPFTPRGSIAHFTRTRERAGLSKDVTIHVLRHTCATNLLKNGADIREVQAWLGHSDISTTVRYTKVLPSRLMNIRDRLEASSCTVSKAVTDEGFLTQAV